MEAILIHVLPYLPGVLVLIPLYVFVLPLLFIATIRQQALPDIKPVDPETPLPEEVRGYFFECHESMSSLGFRNIGTYALPQQIENVQAVMAMFVSESRGTSAMSSVMFAKINGTWVLQLKYTEFSTRVAGGKLIDTSNSNQISTFPEPDGSVKSYHPELVNIDRLHGAHEAMVELHFGNQQRVLRLYKHFDGVVSDYLAACLTEELEGARQVGYFRLVGGDQSQFNTAMADDNPYRTSIEFTPPRYHPTIKGLYLMTWPHMWPFKPVLYRLWIARNRRRLEATGFFGKTNERPS